MKKLKKLLTLINLLFIIEISLGINVKVKTFMNFCSNTILLFLIGIFTFNKNFFKLFNF